MDRFEWALRVSRAAERTSVKDTKQVLRRALREMVQERDILSCLVSTMRARCQTVIRTGKESIPIMSLINRCIFYETICFFFIVILIDFI